MHKSFSLKYNYFLKTKIVRKNGNIKRDGFYLWCQKSIRNSAQQYRISYHLNCIYFGCRFSAYSATENMQPKIAKIVKKSMVTT